MTRHSNAQALPRGGAHGSADWEWYGQAAHFICGDKCRFHLATKVGRYLVSTVGELWPEQAVRKIHAQVHDQKWLTENQHRKGDDFDAAYMRRFGFDTVGCDRKYETMVFEAGKPCSTKECGCGLPEISGSELDFAGYNSAKDARAGHMAMCAKWANQPNAAGEPLPPTATVNDKKNA